MCTLEKELIIHYILPLNVYIYIKSIFKSCSLSGPFKEQYCQIFCSYLKAEDNYYKNIDSGAEKWMQLWNCFDV